MPDPMDETEEFSITLPEAPAGLSEAPLVVFYEKLVKLFGGEGWLSYEPETIALHLGVRPDDLFFDKIEVLRTVLVDPEVQDNASFIIHASDVANNLTADFDHSPIPLSLELAWYIVSMQRLMKASNRPYKASGAIEAISAYLLVEEGYSEALGPFKTMSNIKLTAGQTAADTAAKAQALESYIKHMESL